jgi:hypothetical protein
LPHCASLKSLLSSQHSSGSSNNHSPIPFAESVGQTHSGCSKSPQNMTYRLARVAGPTKLHNDDQSLEDALLSPALQSTTTAHWRTVTTTASQRSFLKIHVAEEARPPSLTESVDRHDNRVHSATPSTGSFTYDRLFSDRLLRAAAVQEKLAAIASTDRGGIASQPQRYSSHALRHVSGPTATLALGSSHGSRTPSVQHDAIVLGHTPKTTPKDRAVRMLEREPLTVQLPSWRVPSAVSVGPASNEPSLSTSHDRGLGSLSQVCHGTPPYPRPRRSKEAVHSILPARDESISDDLHLQQIKFDNLTEDTLGDVEETDALSACSCSSTVD